MFARAAKRGEIGNEVDPDDLAEHFAAGFYFRRLMTHAPIDERFIERQISSVMRAAG